MARKRITRETSLRSWDDVNEALRQIAEKQSAVDSILGRYNEAEARRRKAVDEKVNPLKADIERLEDQMHWFCEDSRQDFGNKKSRELANGMVSFRTGTPKLKTLKGFTWNAVLELLKRSVFKEKYIRVKESVDKEKILLDYASKEITPDVVETMGVVVAQDETFGYEAYVAAKDKDAA